MNHDSGEDDTAVRLTRVGIEGINKKSEREGEREKGKIATGRRSKSETKSRRMRNAGERDREEGDLSRTR